MVSASAGARCWRCCRSFSLQGERGDDTQLLRELAAQVVALGLGRHTRRASTWRARARSRACGFTCLLGASVVGRRAASTSPDSSTSPLGCLASAGTTPQAATPPPLGERIGRQGASAGIVEHRLHRVERDRGVRACASASCWFAVSGNRPMRRPRAPARRCRPAWGQSAPWDRSRAGAFSPGREGPRDRQQPRRAPTTALRKTVAERACSAAGMAGSAWRARSTAPPSPRAWHPHRTGDAVDDQVDLRLAARREVGRSRSRGTTVARSHACSACGKGRLPPSLLPASRPPRHCASSLEERPRTCRASSE